jgi:uroporphyrinogen decarboxylase
MSHRESDKVPADLWTDSGDPGIKTKLQNWTGQKSYNDLLDYFDIDVYRFKPNVAKAAASAGGVTPFFLPPTDSRMLSLSADAVDRPLLNVEDPAELDKFDWPSGDIFDYSNIEAILDAQKHRVLWAQAGTWSPMFCRICELCGMEKVLMDLLENPELIEAIVAKILAFYRDAFRRTLEASKGRLDVFGFGDDFATQRGLMFSRDVWRHFFREPMRELVALIKSYGVYAAYHSCGAISDIIPEFIDMGVDIIFPIQPRADGMEPETLKRDFGSRVVFYGGIDVQHLLPFGTEDEVRAEVERVTGILAKDGGYILASSHGILQDVPPANVAAMYDALRRPTRCGV